MTTILTHDSSFHTDDVFAVAVMLLVYPEAEVVRSREKEKIEVADVVVDTGGALDPDRQRFDHHQPGGAGERENGIPYASFGLVWKEYGPRLSGGTREAAVIDRELAQPVDAHDNGVAIADYFFKGVRAYDIGDFFSSYLNDEDANDGPERLYRIFMQCVGIARDLLIREIAKAKSTVSGEDLIMKLYAESPDKRLIELPTEALPWRQVLGGLPEPLYVVYPRRDNKWGIKCVPDLSKPYGFERKELPESWAGKTGAELSEATGVPDALFAHRGRFMAAVASREGALKLAEIALNS